MKPGSRRKLITAALLGLLAVLLSDFRSTTLPPPLSKAQQEVIKQTHFPFTVAVTAHENPEHPERLVNALRATRLFDRVALLAELPDADLIARVERPIGRKDSIPILTALSLGIAPTTIDKEWGEVFTLNPLGTEQGLLVDFTYEAPTTLGWIATFLNISPDRTAAEPETTKRFNQALSWEICRHSDRIQKLLMPGAES